MGFSDQKLMKEFPNKVGAKLVCYTAQRRVYRRQIRSVNELKRQLIDVCCGLEKSIFDEATDQWRGRLRTCVRA